MQTISPFQFFLSAIKNIFNTLFQNIEVFFCVLIVASVFDFLLFSGYQAINSFHAVGFIVPLSQHYSQYMYIIIGTIKILFIIIGIIQYIASRIKKNPVSIFQALSFAANKKLFIIWMMIIYLGARIISFTIIGIGNIYLGSFSFLLVIPVVIFCLSVWYVVLVIGSNENITRHNAFVKSQQLTKGRRLPIAGVITFLSLTFILFGYFLAYVMSEADIINISNITIPMFSLIANAEVILMAISMVVVYFLLLTDVENKESKLITADIQSENFVVGISEKQNSDEKA